MKRKKSLFVYSRGAAATPATRDRGFKHADLREERGGENRHFHSWRTRRHDCIIRTRSVFKGTPPAPTRRSQRKSARNGRPKRRTEPRMKENTRERETERKNRKKKSGSQTTPSTRLPDVIRCAACRIERKSIGHFFLPWIMLHFWSLRCRLLPSHTRKDHQKAAQIDFAWSNCPTQSVVDSLMWRFSPWADLLS